MADFQNNLKNFEKLDTQVVAASVDPLETAAETARDEELTFPVAGELDAMETVRLTGAYYHAEKQYLHATGFILNRHGTIVLAVYSSGAIGRLTARDCLELIEHLQQQESSDS